MTPCRVLLRRVSDRIIIWLTRLYIVDHFVTFFQDSQNGYGIRVSGTAVSQHWGNVILLYNENLNITLCMVDTWHTVHFKMASVFLSH